MIRWSILKKKFIQPSNGLCIARNVPGIDVILINHIHYNYLEHDVIEYLYNNNKIRYYDIGLYIY